MNPKETINFIFQSNVAGINKAVNSVKKLNQHIKNTKKASNGSFNAMNNGMIETGTIAEKLGNKFGFIAFQWTFIAGTASRALNEIRMAAQEVFREGAEGMSKIQRASLEAFELGDSLDETNRKMKIFSQYAQEMGSGETMFGAGEIADTLKEVVKATNDINSAIPITNSLLKLMTIEEVDAAKGAKGFLAVMNNFKLTGEDVNRVTNTLVAVNKQSRLSLDEVIHSYEFAGQQARLMGLDIEEAGTLIGMIGDQLPAGTVGRTFSQMLVNFRKETVALNPLLSQMGVNLYDNEGNMRGFANIMRDMSKMMKDAGDKNDYFRDSLLRSMKLDTRAERVFLALINNFEEYEDRLEKVRRGGEYVDFLYEQLKNSPEAAMKRIQHALGQLKIQLVAGFAPALLQILEILMEFVRREEIQRAFHAIGKAIGQNIIPVVEGAVWLFRGLVALYKKLGLGADGLSKIFLGLSLALGSLVVVGTLITLFAMFASLAEKAAAKMAVLGITTRFTNMTMSSFLIGMMRVGAIMFGLWFLISGVNRLITTLSDGFQEGEEEAVLMGLGLTALGAAMVALPLLPLITRLAGAVAGSAALTGAFGVLSIAMKGVGVAFMTTPLGAAIAVFAAVATATYLATEAIKDHVNAWADVKPNDDLATVWQKIFLKIGDLSAEEFIGGFHTFFEEKFAIGQWIWDAVSKAHTFIMAQGGLLAAMIDAGFKGDWSRMFDIGGEIQRNVTSAAIKFKMSGVLLAESIWQGIVDFFTGKTIWDAVMAQDTYFKYSNPDLFEDDRTQEEKDAAKLHPAFQIHTEQIQENVDSLAETVGEVEVATETVVTEVEEFTEGMDGITKEAEKLAEQVEEETKAIIKENEITTKVSDAKEEVEKTLLTSKNLEITHMARMVELIRDKMRLHDLYQWQIEIMDQSFIPETINTVTHLVEFQDRLIVASNAFDRLAWAADRTVSRLASVKISASGKFSMASFGALPGGMINNMPVATPTRGVSQDIMNQLLGLRPEAPVVNNNIELTMDIESIRSEEDIERMAGLVADKIAEELPSKSVTE